MIKNHFRFVFIFSLLIFQAPALVAANIELDSDQEILVEEYGKPNDHATILWLTSERGVTKNLKSTLEHINQATGLHIVLPDWHNSYFLSPTRSSLSKIPDQDFAEVINHYREKYKNMVIFSHSRSAAPLLKAIRRLQTQGKPAPNGIIFMSPYLQKRTPEIGKAIEYQQIAKFSNLPLYVMQPERSPRFVPLPKLLKSLEEGGSPVFTQVLKGTSGGFHMRDKADLTERDIIELNNFPKTIKNALTLLQTAKAAPLKPLSDYEKTVHQMTKNNLQKVTMPSPGIVLKDLNNKEHNLSDYKGKTVIVSFWASWCRPCIEEMPSLVKLKADHKDSIEILAVNVREDKATINKFTQTMGINFPLLQDHDSKFVDAWKVYVYPSNYIVDKEGVIQYAATGAMDWQAPEILRILNTL